MDPGPKKPHKAVKDITGTITKTENGMWIREQVCIDLEFSVFILVLFLRRRMSLLEERN